MSATKPKYYPKWLDGVDVTAIPVQVVGTHNHEVFSSLATAQEKYPCLNPYEQSKVFTWGMRGSVSGKDAIRFETWAANKMYSA